MTKPISWRTWTKPEVNSTSHLYPSETSPNQALSVSDILDRFSRGLGVPTNAGYYFQDEEVPDPRGISRLDYMDWVKDFNLEYARRVAAAEADPEWVKPEFTGEEFDSRQAIKDRKDPEATVGKNPINPEGKERS